MLEWFNYDQKEEIIGDFFWKQAHFCSPAFFGENWSRVVLVLLARLTSKMYLSQLQNIFVQVASISNPCFQALGPHLVGERSPLLLNLAQSCFPAPRIISRFPPMIKDLTSMQSVWSETGREAQGV